MDLSRFEHFAPAIAALPDGDLSEDLPSFLLAERGDISIYYAPFDWLNLQARVVVVGITPGRDSMTAGFRAARTALKSGATNEEAAKQAKRTGSFSNMRFTIARLLDELNLNHTLGLPTCSDLFGARGDLLHPTSCVRYPVFRNGENYTGSTPPLPRFEMFRPYIFDVLGAELDQLPNAIIVPCGVRVAEALQLLISAGRLDDRRCLTGFPHASGANGHLGRIWIQERDQLRRRVDCWAGRAV